MAPGYPPIPKGIPPSPAPCCCDAKSCSLHVKSKTRKDARMIYKIITCCCCCCCTPIPYPPNWAETKATMAERTMKTFIVDLVVVGETLETIEWNGISSRPLIYANEIFFEAASLSLTQNGIGFSARFEFPINNRHVRFVTKIVKIQHVHWRIISTMLSGLHDNSTIRCWNM